MRVSVLVLVSLAAAGCIHPTPMTTPEVLQPGQTRVEVGFTSVLYQGTARVRAGLLPRTEASARLDLSLFGAAMLGGDVSVQVVPPVGPNGIAAVATLGASRSYIPEVWGEDASITDYLYPAVTVGTEGVHGGVRAILPRQGGLSYGVGPFVGRQVDSQIGSMPVRVHGELALVYFRDPNGLGGTIVFPFPSVTFSRR